MAVPAAALAADAADGVARGEAGNATAAPTGQPGAKSDATAGSPRSPAQQGVVEDLRDGKRQCEGLSGKEREACVARAAATAQIPRGREGANPTGSTKPSAGKATP